MVFDICGQQKKNKMKTIFLLAITIGSIKNIHAQAVKDSSTGGTAVAVRDSRVDVLGQKLAAHNAANHAGSALGPTSASGYRLMVVSTSDRDLAMKVRTQLFQFFPDQKLYMSYQMPNIKIEFGNFLERSDAEKVKKQIVARKIVSNNIYVLSRTIEIKPEKKDSTEKDK